MELPDNLEPQPVDERRRTLLALAALAVLQRDDATPLEHQWAREVYDLCIALGEERETNH